MRWQNYLFVFFTLVISLTITKNLQAQTSSIIEEIVVTSTKKNTSLQDTPISVSVLQMEDIETLAISDILDLQSSVPSLQINQTQFAAQNTFLIRGFGNGANNPGVEPSVAISIDGVMISRNQSAINDLISVERVEVIKGPQSTLFGKNAIAGVINITTALPEDTFGGKVQLTAGDYSLNKISGTVTGPISENTSFRISGTRHKRDGYTKNLALGTEINDRDRYAIRAQLLTNLSEDLTVRVIVDKDEADENCCTTAPLLNGAVTIAADALLAPGVTTIVNPPRTWGYETYLNFDPAGTIENQGISVHVDYDLGFANLTSITAYRESSQAVNGDVDFSSMPLLTNGIFDDFETFTQEFRLTSNSDGPLQWMVGAWYQDESVQHDRNVFYKELIGPFIDLILSPVGTSLNGIAGQVAVQGLAQISNLPPAAQTALLGTALPPLTTAQIGGVLAGVSTGNPALDGGIAAIIPGLAAQQRASWYKTNGGLQNEYFDMDNEAFSIFAQVDYDISSNTSISIGLSYSEDEKEVVSNVIIDDEFAAIPFILNPATAALAGFQFFPPFFNYPNANEDGKWNSDDVTHSVKLIHEFDDSLSAYISHSTGFKAISTNLGANATVYAGLPMDPSIYFANPEEAENFEVGFKKTFSNGYLNMSFFHMAVEGYQSNLFIGTGFNLVNIGEQTNKGVEIDSLFFLNENFVVTFAASYIDATYNDFKNGPCDRTFVPPASDDCPIVNGGP
ncbi:MAG: TonB-dependent receptor, partial [Hyphomicrobiales bacterium]